MSETLSYIQLIIQSIYYITYGFMFVGIIRFVGFRENNSELKQNILSYVVAGILLKTVYDKTFSFTKQGDFVYILLTYAITILIAYIIGLLFSHTSFLNKLLLKIGIKRTPNKSIWFDMMEPYTELVVHLDGGEYCYIGDLVFIEENCRNPKVVLANYQLVRESDATVVLDYDNTPDRRIMIDTESITLIEFVYQSRKNKI